MKEKVDRSVTRRSTAVPNGAKKSEAHLGLRGEKPSQTGLIFAPFTAVPKRSNRLLTSGKVTETNEGRPFFCWRLAVSAALVVLLIGLSTGCKKLPAATPAAPTVIVSQPIQEQIADWDKYAGRFEAVNTVELKARISGYVQEVNFTDGALVKEGQLLFVIDPRPYQAAVTEAEGRLAEARSKLALANQDLSRAQKLVESRAIAANTYDERTQAVESAQANVAMATGALERSRLELSFTRVISPISGRIGRRLISAGNLVTGGDGSGTSLATIVSLDPIDIYFDIDEQSYLKYSRAQLGERRSSLATTENPVQVWLPGDSQPTLKGRLDFLDNRLDVSTGTLKARARLRNPNLLLSPGQFGRVEITIGEPHSALLLPETAIPSDDSGRVVYVVTGEGEVSICPVTVGRLVDGLREISGGLNATDLVITEGLQQAVPGTKVTPEVQLLAEKNTDFRGASR